MFMMLMYDVIMMLIKVMFIQMIVSLSLWVELVACERLELGACHQTKLPLLEFSLETLSSDGLVFNIDHH